MIWQKMLYGTGALLLSTAILLAGSMEIGEAAEAGSSNAQDVLVRAQERDATFAPARSVTSLLKAVTTATLISSSVICHRHITHGAFGIYARRTCCCNDR